MCRIGKNKTSALVTSPSKAFVLALCASSSYKMVAGLAKKVVNQRFSAVTSQSRFEGSPLFKQLI
jgi:hypothetical protein